MVLIASSWPVKGTLSWLKSREPGEVSPPSKRLLSLLRQVTVEGLTLSTQRAVARTPSLAGRRGAGRAGKGAECEGGRVVLQKEVDRKSTRLNSSHT